MRNSESGHLLTHNYFWKLVSISNKIELLFLNLFNTIRTNKQTNKQTQQLSFKTEWRCDICGSKARVHSMNY